MRNKRLLSFALALGVTATAFSGLTLTAEAAADSVTFKPAGAAEAVVLNAEWPEYYGDGETLLVSFDDDADTVTFHSDITLEANGVSGTYGTCISSTGPSGSKSMTISIPEGVSVTMDNTSSASGWSTAFNGTSTGDVTITGGGKLIITGGGSGGAYGMTPYGRAITIDNVTVSATGAEYGAGYYIGGSLTVTNGGVLEAAGGTAAFESGSTVSVDSGTAIAGGNDASSAAAIDAGSIASYKYVRIGGEGGTVPPQPTEAEPTEETPTEPAGEIDPDLPTGNFSNWVGIQPKRDGRLEWLYDGHYMMQDGTHLSTANNGEPDGSEAVYYDRDTGTLTFRRDMTIYGASSESEYKTYYGTGISWDYSPGDIDSNMVIRLENGADVTIDATNRAEHTYLYGLYGTGKIVVTGDGTLTINANSGTSDNYAMCVFNGKESSALGNIIIKDNVTLRLTNEDANGIGLGLYGAGAGSITVKDNAVVEAYGGQRAVNKAPEIPETASVNVGDSADTASEWDGSSDITAYKYVKIEASPSQPGTDPTPTVPGGEPEPTRTPGAPTSTPEPPTEPPAELPETGVIWEDDYERWSVYDWQSANLAQMRVANGGDYGNIYRMNIDLADGHGKVLKSTTGDGSHDRGFDFYPRDVVGADDYVEINSGTLLVSAQVCIPSGFVMNSEDMELNNYVYTWTEEALNNNASSDRAYLFKAGVTHGDTTGKISFQTGQPSNIVSADDTNSVSVEFDTWHTVDVVINYDAGTVDYYVDGNRVTSYPGSPDDVTKYFPLAYLQLHQNGRHTSSDRPLTFLWDNFRLERMDRSMSAEVTGSGTDYVDVKFSRPLTDSAVNSAQFSVRRAGDSGAAAAAAGAAKLSGDTVRVSFDSLEPATAYELVFGSALSAAYGGGSIAAGESLVFTTDAALTETTLIDMDFEGADNGYTLVHSMPDDRTYVEDPDNTSKYAQIRGGVLYYDHYLDVSGQEFNGLRFPFADGAAVDSGIVTAEFDAGVTGETNRSRAVFGLEDPKRTDTAWSSATVFGGIMPYDGSRLSFTRASQSSRNSLTSDSGMDITAAITAQEEMHHYKIVIDMDNCTYQLYYDGALAADLDYIPGGNTDNSFNAFTMSGVYATSEFTPDSGATYLMLDNLKVTSSVSAAAVSGVTMVKYDGTESAYASVVPAGTKEIRLSFTKTMAADTAEHITVTGLDENEYSVTCEGSEAVVTIDDCLDANASYVMTVSADAEDSSGTAVAGEMTYRFTADAGEVVYYKPVINDGGSTVTSSVTVVNTTDSDIDDFYITLACYDGEGRLTGLVPLQAEYARSEGYTKTFTVTGNAEAFAGAASIASFVFADLENIRPLTECAETAR